MVNIAAVIELVHPIATDTWIKASWQDFTVLAEEPAYEDGRLYFDRERIRIEMLPLGASHIQDDPLVARVISLFATLKGLWFKAISTGSF